jgi:hypothetical protein
LLKNYRASLNVVGSIPEEVIGFSSTEAALPAVYVSEEDSVSNRNKYLEFS